MNLKASYTDCRALPSGVKLGKMEGSTGHLKVQAWFYSPNFTVTRTRHTNRKNVKWNKIHLPLVVDNLKRAFRIFRHSYATASEYAIWSCTQNININSRQITVDVSCRLLRAVVRVSVSFRKMRKFAGNRLTVLRDFNSER